MKEWHVSSNEHMNLWRKFSIVNFAKSVSIVSFGVCVERNHSILFSTGLHRLVHTKPNVRRNILPLEAIPAEVIYYVYLYRFLRKQFPSY